MNDQWQSSNGAEAQGQMPRRQCHVCEAPFATDGELVRHREQSCLGFMHLLPWWHERALQVNQGGHSLSLPC
jgi:hypothetical protein